MAKNDNLGDFLTDIANAIRTKKESSGTINAQDFSSEILSITTGGGDSLQQLYDIDVTLVAPAQNLGGMDVDLYAGSTDLTKLYNDCVSSDYEKKRVFIINDVAVRYYGDISSDVGFPIPIFSFGNFDERTLSAESFLIADMTPMGTGLGITLAKIIGTPVANNKIVIKRGFEFLSFPIIFPENLKYISDFAFYKWEANNHPLVIPNSVTSIGEFAFYYWTSNNHPLVIPNSVTSIGEFAFDNWTSNNQPLVIPNSVTSIGEYAFYKWTSNNQPLVISNSVTNIGRLAFSNWDKNNQPLVIGNSVTSIGNYAFSYWTSNNQPLVIGNSVTSIGEQAFREWDKNNHPLVIPNSVTSIGEFAFYKWEANNHPLVIPNSVTSIGRLAFDGWNSVPYAEIYATTPPTLEYGGLSGSYPIYVPDASLNAYKTATNWTALASRIFSINEK